MSSIPPIAAFNQGDERQFRMVTALLFLIVASVEAGEPGPHPLDPLMRDVTEACLLPDLKIVDPRPYLSEHGWARSSKSDTFEKRIGPAVYSVTIKWPASERSVTSCSFDSDDTPAVEVYDWFRSRIGEPRDVVWSDQKLGGWRLQTNGHGAGVYVSRKRKNGSGDEGMMLHVLQGHTAHMRK